MATLKKYNIEGKEIGEVTIDKSFYDVDCNEQLIKDYIVAIRNNKRQWSASTKGRSEVKHTTKKPHRQKGTGSARQGSLVAPQYRGGGIVFGPKPKFDQHVRINKKERRKAIRFLLSEKIKNNRVLFIDETNFEKPSTKKMVNFLNACGLTKRVLFLGEGISEEVQTEERKEIVSVKCQKHTNFIKSLRNIPKIQFSLAKNISGYDVMVAGDIILTENAFNEIKTWLSN